MANHTGSWLEDVLHSANEFGWCVRARCTTCGAMKFRKAYWGAAADEARVSLDVEHARRPRGILAGIPREDRDLVVRTVIDGLAGVSTGWADSDAVETILTDLDPPLTRHGVPLVLDEALAGTPVGEALAWKRSYSTERAEARRQQAQFESPEAVAERRQAARDARADEHAERLREKRVRDEERAALLTELERLAPLDRLRRFAYEEGVILDAIPNELVPTDGVDWSDLNPGTARRLLERIGRRRGAWALLRRALHQVNGRGMPAEESRSGTENLATSRR